MKQSLTFRAPYGCADAINFKEESPKIEDIKHAIKELLQEEYSQVRNWFLEKDRPITITLDPVFNACFGFV